MEARFGYFSKDKDSTKQPVADFGDLITTVRLKEPCSTTHPVFIINSTNQYNYVKWNNKYYFVDEIVHVTNELSEYHCTEDVLASWKSSIGNSTEYVVRATRAFNTYIPDGIYSLTSDKSMDTTVLNNLHSQIVSQITGYFMVGIFGRAGNSGCVTYYAMTAGQFKNLMLDMFDISNYAISIDEISYGLQKALLNPIQYIESIKYYPFASMPTGVLESVVKFGFWQANVSAFRITNDERTLTFTSAVLPPEHFKYASVGKFYNGSPYTRRTLYLYNFGAIPIDCSYFIEHDELMHVTILCDTFTGMGEAQISDDHAHVMARLTAQMGIDVEIAQMSRDVTGGIEKIINNPLGASILQGSSTFLIGATSGIANSAEALFPTTVTSTGGKTSDVTYKRPPLLVSEFFNTTEYDPTHFGRPLCAQKQISTLANGFVKVDKPKIEIIGTSWEHEQIKMLMEQGFYYE